MQELYHSCQLYHPCSVITQANLYQPCVLQPIVSTDCVCVLKYLKQPKMCLHVLRTPTDFLPPHRGKHVSSIVMRNLVHKISMWIKILMCEGGFTYFIYSWDQHPAKLIL